MINLLIEEGNFTYWTMNSGNYDSINFIQPSDDKDYSADAKTELHTILQDVDFKSMENFFNEKFGIISAELFDINSLDLTDNEKLYDLEKFIKEQLRQECPGLSAYRKQKPYCKYTIFC